MLAIARGLMARPRLLMNDEPFLGLALRIVDQIAETITRIDAEGVAILCSSSRTSSSLGLAHRGFVLECGRTVLEERSACP